MSAMSTVPSTFNDILEAIDRLPLDAQAEVIGVVRQRLRERERHDVVESVREAKKEFREGKLKPKTAEQIIQEMRL